MPPDSTNARDALRDQSEPKSGSDSGAESASNPPVPIDPEDANQAALAQLSVGSVVDGKYRVDQVLGRGAMGVVVQATHLQLGERVALKFLRYKNKGNTSDDFQSRFKREARVSARLKNEHITRVIDVGVWRDQVPYMVMDHLTGTDLREVIKKNGPLPIHVAIDYAVQLCEGIAEAHVHGVVHRDLKPSNLFVTKRPDGSDLIKILDFGISKWNADETEIDELTQTGVVLGSPKYMAPEQLFGSGEVDARADVWSVGAIVYEMLCGRPPFDLPTFTKICAELSTDRPPPSLVERRAEVPPALEAVVMRCFARTPSKRVQNVAELAGDILAAVDAPFADAVRTKIALILEPKSSRDPLKASGSSTLGSGSYSRLLVQSGSTPHFPPSSTSPVAHPAKPPSTPVPDAYPRPKRSRLLWIAPLAGIALGTVAWLLFSGKSEEKPAHPTGPEATVEPAAPTTTAAATAAPSTTTSAAPTTTAAATGTPAATATTSASTAPTVAPPTFVHAPWRSPPRVRPTVVVAPPPPQTAAPPATTAAPVATTPPANTAKPDPLGDRQ